ncbi:hypothetical protein [Gilvimarinus algae]|uniref:Peptidase M15 n=1 Tax=Gilvimarinus algae TaxID=3058037 RepID=A0ABT8TJ27_9GAMM|nr:hypothetical protein [Gilvimarinus sp. SDUM040014]MDO3384060.1 hypothetical protein [Gilvimarinus sp. SDUM040014]
MLCPVDNPKQLETKLDKLGRVRLSKSFFMRDMLYSTIAQAYGLVNIPDHPEVAIEAGKGLCENLLEPMQQQLGPIAIRSAYRSPAVNELGNREGLNCASNEKNYAHHIWDYKDADGYLGATATVVVPSFIDYFETTGDWTALAWWIHDHLPNYASLYFFPKYAAFNIRWSENPNTTQSIKSYVTNPHTGDKKALVQNGDVQRDFNREHVYRPWLDSRNR